jgi:hypothetical protein
MFSWDRDGFLLFGHELQFYLAGDDSINNFNYSI